MSQERKCIDSKLFRYSIQLIKIQRFEQKVMYHFHHIYQYKIHLKPLAKKFYFRFSRIETRIDIILQLVIYDQQKKIKQKKFFWKISS